MPRFRLRKLDTIMKAKLIRCVTMLALLGGIGRVPAQTMNFFRISGPGASAITEFRNDGTMIWTNALANTNYIVQRLAAFNGVSNWVDYVRLTVAAVSSTNRIIDLHPPQGMVFIPGGVFTIGDTLDTDITQATPINVTVSGFYLDANLVSYGQWQSVYNWATNHGYGFVNAGAGKAANHPAHTLDWFDALKWCNARSQMAALTPVYYTDTNLTQVYTNGEGAGNPSVPYVSANWAANGYRLPTEAEWEKAARGGLSGQRFPWGLTISQSQANYPGATSLAAYDLGPDGYNPAVTNGGYPYTTPVGNYAPNGYGVRDMAGNLWEWCWDLGGYAYPGGTDPRGPTPPAFGYYRVIRGGSWNYTARNLRSAFRSNRQHSTADYTAGFRCVRGR